MAINLSGLSSLSNAAPALSNLILATPLTSNPANTKGYQPQNPPNSNGQASTKQQPPTLLFQIEGENVVNLTSDITDHYVESNIAIQDQIALKPEIVKVHGYIGELNDVVPPTLALLQQTATTLTSIGAYGPSLSVTALLAYNKALLAYETAENSANAAVAAFSSISSAITGNSGQEIVTNTGVFQSGANIAQNKQQSMFQQLFGYWATRTLFTIQTPWAIFSDMAILSINSVQDDKTRMVTDFEVTFKKIRTATTLTTSGGLVALQDGRALTSSASVNNLGSQSGTPGFSLASQIAKIA